MGSIKTEMIVIGGANMDIKAKSAGVLVAGSSNPGSVTIGPGGVGRNIAHNLARLGVKVGLITAVGNDSYGRDIVAKARSAGIDASMAVITEEPTGTYVATLDHAGEMTVAVNAMEGTAQLTVEVLKHRHDRLANANLIVADCNIPEESLQFLARYRDKLVIEPVSVAKCVKMKGIGPLLAATPNHLQAEALTGVTIANPDDARRAAMALHSMGLSKVMVGLGPQGCVISEAGRETMHIPIHRAGDAARDATGGGDAARDATGGGDAAVAGFVYGILRGLPLDQSGQLAQAAASLAIASLDTVSERLSLGNVMDLARPRFRAAS
jgi:pseudouridine kinase